MAREFLETMAGLIECKLAYINNHMSKENKSIAKQYNKDLKDIRKQLARI